MTTASDLHSMQITAATRYNAALTELYASYVDLAALDSAVASAQALGGPLRSFGSNLDELRAALHAHPLASAISPVPLSDLLVSARNAYVAALTTG